MDIQIDMMECAVINNDSTPKYYSFVDKLPLNEILAKGGKYAIVYDGFKNYYLENTSDGWQLLQNKVVIIPENTYLSFAVSSDSTLSLVTCDSSASRAWLRSDKAFSEIIGTKFSYISLTNGQTYFDNKKYFRRLSNLEEFKKLLPDNVILVREPTFEKV